MQRTRLLYQAGPGQISLRPGLTNTHTATIALDGFAIPRHIDGYGHPIDQGFDVTDMVLLNQTTFASDTAVTMLPRNSPIVWNQCPQALQWADSQVPYVYGRDLGS